MSKKNLARTAIEGGRANKWERDRSNSDARAFSRTFIHEISGDPEGDAAPQPRRKVSKDFKDKLNPINRWLRKQVGKKWDVVHAELRERFDARTIAGQHILYDHILNQIDSHEFHAAMYGGFSGSEYFVDAEGVLRYRTSWLTRRRYRSNREKDTTTKEAIEKWRDGKYVRLVGTKLFWLVSTYEVNKFGGTYRQDTALSKKDVAFYNSLASHEKDSLDLDAALAREKAKYEEQRLWLRMARYAQ